jgi:manganese oxidase
MSEKQNSRRKFIKAGAIAGGAAVVGLSLGLPNLTKATNSGTTNPTTTNEIKHDAIFGDSSSYDFGYFAPYKPKERWYFMYATDGVAWVPTDKFGLSRRPVFMYGFAKPISDKNPSGFAKGDIGAPGVGPPSDQDKAQAFADLNWLDGATNMPVMAGKAQITGPPIWGVEGDILDITLCNLGFAFPTGIMDPHTIHLHGVHAPNYYDGIPEISFGVPMWWNTDPTMRPAPMTTANIKNYSFTYRMFCERPGTYMYHCHVEASEHVQMGMYGPLWIYPKQYANVQNGGAAYDNILTKFDQEATVLLSDIDTRWHDSILDFSALTTEPTPTTPGLTGSVNGYNIPDYRPDYWLVNGRSLPDTVLGGKYTMGYQQGLFFVPNATPSSQAAFLHPIARQVSYYPGVTSLSLAGGDLPGTLPAASVTAPLFIPRQPVQSYLRTEVGEKVLVRLLNMGFQNQPYHFHGVMPAIVGRDTFAYVPQFNNMFGTPTDQRKREFTFGVFSGQTFDLIASYPDKSKINPSVYSFINENVPVKMPFSASDPADPDLIAAGLPDTSSYATLVNAADNGIPLATGVPTAVPGAPASGVADGFYREYPLLYLWHAHDDYKVTNAGVYPGGAVVVVRVDKQGTFGPKPNIVKTLIPA